MKKFILISATLLASAAVIISIAIAPASAGIPEASYSSNMCNATYGDQEGDFSYQIGRLITSSTSSRWVTCPVPVAKSDSGLLRVNVGIYDSSSSYTIACYLYVYPTLTSSSGYIDYDSASSGSTFTGNKTLTLEVSKGSGAKKAAMYCNFRNNDKLGEYRVYDF